MIQISKAADGGGEVQGRGAGHVGGGEKGSIRMDISYSNFYGVHIVVITVTRGSKEGFLPYSP